MQAVQSTSRAVAISCAVTEAIHTPSMSPHRPVMPMEIADLAIAAAEPEAAILHLHVRDPETGQPDQRLEACVPFPERIKQSTDAVINPTSGGSPLMKVRASLEDSLSITPGKLAASNAEQVRQGVALVDSSSFGWQRPRRRERASFPREATALISRAPERMP